MKWTIKDIHGSVVSFGTSLMGEEIEIPTHGSISIEVEEDIWINFLSSEWLTLTFSDHPRGWGE